VERRVAQVLVAVSALCLVLDTVFTAAQTSLLSAQAWAEHAWPLIPLATLGCSAMGALILRQRPGHAVGRLLLVAGLCSIAGPAESYSTWVLAAGGPGPPTAGHMAAWLSLVFTAPLGVTALVLIYLLAPDGRLRSRAWRWVAWTALLGLGLWLLAVAMLPPTDVTLNEPTGNRVSDVLGTTGFLLIGATLLAATASLALQVRRARGETRRRLLWIAASAALIAAALAPTLLLPVAGVARPSALAVALFAAYGSMPVFTAVAVLRHRLFDIDVIVSRALVVALATAVVSAAYVLAVATLGPLLSGGAGVLVTLLATAAIALAFQPLRRRTIRVADRLAYGAAAVPYEALADLTRRLSASPDPATLLPAVADAAGRAVGADRVTVRLRVGAAGDRSSTWPVGAHRRGGPEVEIAIADDAPLGRITVEMPPGRPLRPADLALLQDLADAAAGAFRSALLTAELADRVDELDRRATDLEASRRRLLTADDVERERLALAISRDVLPHLAAMPDQLTALSRGDPDPVLVEPLIAEAVTALDALRDITRGVYPAQLARSGLGPALRSLLDRNGSDGLVVSAQVAGLRFAAPVEAAAYFCLAEAARVLCAPVQAVLDSDGDRLRVEVSGAGDVDPATLAAMRDRVGGAGGSVALSVGGVRSVLAVTMPAVIAPPAQPGGALAAQAAASAAGPSADLVR
jgi:hypothetical protein